MARRPTIRLLALLLLATFSFAQVGRAHTHQCPTHDGGVNPASAHHAGGPRDSSTQSSGPEAARSNSQAAAGSHAQPTTSDNQQEHEQCNCLGECCTSAVAVNLGANVQLSAATSYNLELRFHSSNVVLPLNPEHQLPLSTGPPSQVSSA